jgi:hypothetical protein
MAPDFTGPVVWHFPFARVSGQLLPLWLQLINNSFSFILKIIKKTPFRGVSITKLFLPLRQTCKEKAKSEGSKFCHI